MTTASRWQPAAVVAAPMAAVAAAVDVAVEAVTAVAVVVVATEAVKKRNYFGAISLH